MFTGGTWGPLRERRFRLLWLGRVSSAVGDAVVPVALAFAVLSIHRSATALGSVLAAFTIARVAFTLAGGVVADRLPRRAVMLICDVIRGLVEAFTAAMLLTHNMTLPLFIVTGALFGAASAFFGPASDGLVPQTVSPNNLQAANALLVMSRNSINVVGPALSGVLIAVAGTGWVFAIDALSFFVSASFLYLLKVDPHARSPRSRFLTEVRAGLGEVTSRGWVRIPLVCFAISNFAFASFIVLGPIVFRDEFHGARDWGIAATFGSLGAVVGALVSGRIAPRHPLTAGFLTSTLIAAPIAALSGPLPLAAICVAWFAGMAAIALSNTWWETALQRFIPMQVYARVRSYDILVSFIFMPLGMVAFGPIADAVGAEWTLLVSAAVLAGTNLVVAFAPDVRAVTELAPRAEAAAA